MITKLISYKNYYKFKARIYTVTQSFNRIGVDPLPRHFIRPTELLEVMAYSNTPKSTDSGFEKAAEAGLYLKDRSNIGKTITYGEIDSQFEFIRLRPPFWYHDESSFIEFIRVNMDKTRQGTLEGIYNASDSKLVVINGGEDADIEVEHTYKEITQWTTRTFKKEVNQNWPKEKGVIISKVN